MADMLNMMDATYYLSVIRTLNIYSSQYNQALILPLS